MTACEHSLASLSAIVVAFNDWDDVQGFVARWRERFSGLHLVIVDNASPTPPPSALLEAADLDYVRSPVNLGYGGGVNLGWTRCPSTDDLLVVNSDVDLDFSVLSAMACRLRERPDISVCAARLVNADGTLQDSAREFGSPLDLARRIVDRVRGAERLRSAYPDGHDGPVDWVMGALMLIRAETMQVLGGFDERYFMYCEDIDFCRRARAVGSVWLLDTPRALHNHRRASTSRITRLTLVHMMSWARYYLRWGPTKPKPAGTR